METRLKTAEDFTIPKAYTLQKAEYVKELDSFALVLKHNLSGARILVFSNEDDNKVFQHRHFAHRQWIQYRRSSYH